MVAVLFLLNGCMTAIALKEERRKVNELPEVTYSLKEDVLPCSQAATFVNDYTVKELNMGPKIHLYEFDVSCFVRDALARRAMGAPRQKEAVKSLIIVGAEADAKLSTFWKGPWGKIVITAEVVEGDGSKKYVKATGSCHMVSENIEIFSREQILHTARNAADALVAAIAEGKNEFEIGQNMDCLPDGHVINN